MNVIQTLVLLYCSLSGLYLVAYGPSRRWRSQTKGMNPAEITAYKQEKNEVGISHGCAYQLMGLAELAQNYIIEPAYVIWAILTPIQPVGLAYTALAIFILKTATLLLTLLVRMQPSDHPTSSIYYWIGVAFWATPTLYLWFLLLAMIGLVR